MELLNNGIEATEVLLKIIKKSKKKLTKEEQREISKILCICGIKILDILEENV